VSIEARTYQHLASGAISKVTGEGPEFALYEGNEMYRRIDDLPAEEQVEAWKQQAGVGSAAGAVEAAAEEESSAAASKYEGLTMAELADELEARDLPKSGNKPDLIARLEKDDGGYPAWTVPELQELAAEYEIEGRSSLNKDDLIAAIEKYEEENPELDGGDE